jgi:DNA-directed RNA polymerase subunit RPC12/RpoP
MVTKIAEGQYKCCGKIMQNNTTTISHTTYQCLKCGKRVQAKGGWGTPEMIADGFEVKTSAMVVA